MSWGARCFNIEPQVVLEQKSNATIKSRRCGRYTIAKPIDPSEVLATKRRALTLHLRSYSAPEPRDGDKQ